MSSFNHSQGTSSTSWVITHNLDVGETVVDTLIDNGGNLEKILPLSVIHTDNNTLTISFTAAQTGKARIIGN